MQIKIGQENLSPLTLSSLLCLLFLCLSLPPPLHPISSILLSPKLIHPYRLTSPSLPLTISPHPPLLSPSLWLVALFGCQSSRRIDDDSLEEQIRQTSEDSRALRELMEGERGKLRQSLEELQQLHSQVSTPILGPVQGMYR